MTFADTSGWYALLVPTDAYYDQARDWFAANRTPVLTTDYVIDETLTLLRSKGHNDLALDWGAKAFTGKLAAVHYLNRDEIAAAWQVFQRFRDKGWSFTDCTSKVVSESLGVPQAFAFDQHFRQFGSVAVAP